MLTRSPRTILAISAALALTASALGSGAVLAKGPNGNGACSGDCTADQQGAQRQARAGVGSDSSQAIGRRGLRDLLDERVGPGLDVMDEESLVLVVVREARAIR